MKKLQVGGHKKRFGVINKRFALVDDCDFEKLNKYKWWFAHGYAARINNGEMKYLHQEIMGEKEGKEIDHKDRNGLNNQRENLRFVTSSENKLNTSIRKDNTSGAKGVSWHKKRKKWTARIWEDKKQLFLGYFNSLKEAVTARKTAIKGSIQYGIISV